MLVEAEYDWDDSASTIAVVPLADVWENVVDVSIYDTTATKNFPKENVAHDNVGHDMQLDDSNQGIHNSRTPSHDAVILPRNITDEICTTDPTNQAHQEENIVTEGPIIVLQTNDHFDMDAIRLEVSPYMDLQCLASDASGDHRMVSYQLVAVILSVLVLVVPLFIVPLISRKQSNSRKHGKVKGTLGVDCDGRRERRFDYLYEEELILDRILNFEMAKSIGSEVLHEIYYIAKLLEQRVIRDNVAAETMIDMRVYSTGEERVLRSVNDLILRYFKEIACESNDIEDDHDRLHRDYEIVEGIQRVLRPIRREIEDRIDRCLSVTFKSLAVAKIMRGMENRDIDGVMYGMALYDEWCLLSIGHADDRASDVIYQEGNSYLQKVVQSKVSHDNLSTQKRVQNLRSRIENPDVGLVVNDLMTSLNDAFTHMLITDDNAMPENKGTCESHGNDSFTTSTKQTSPAVNLLSPEILLTIASNEVIRCQDRVLQLHRDIDHKRTQLRSEARRFIQEQQVNRLQFENHREVLRQKNHQTEIHDQMWLFTRRNEISKKIQDNLRTRRQMETLWFAFIAVCVSCTFIGMSSYCYNKPWSIESVVVAQCRAFCVHLDRQASSGRETVIASYIRDTLGFDPFDQSASNSSFLDIGDYLYMFTPSFLSSISQWYWSKWLHDWNLSELWARTELFMCGMKILRKMLGISIFVFILRFLPGIRFWVAEIALAVFVMSIGEPIATLLEPLRPISLLLVAHCCLFSYLHYFDRRLSWKVQLPAFFFPSQSSEVSRKRDIRCAFVWYLYPLIIMLITSRLSCVFFKG